MKKVWIPNLNGESYFSFYFLSLSLVTIFLFQAGHGVLIPFGKCKNDTAVIECPSSGNGRSDEAWHVSLSWLFGLWNFLFVLGASQLADSFVNAKADLLVEIQAKVAQNIMKYGMSENSNFDSLIGLRMTPRGGSIDKLSKDLAKGIWDGAAGELASDTIQVMRGLVTDNEFFFGTAPSIAPKKRSQQSSFLDVNPDDFKDLIRKYRQTMKTFGIVFYLISLAILVGYSVVYYILTGSFVVCFNCFSLACSDAILLVKISPVSMLQLNINNSGTQINLIKPVTLNLLLLCFRIFLLSIPTDYWYIGECCTFVLTSIFLWSQVEQDLLVSGSSYLSVPRERGFKCWNYVQYFCREIVLLFITVYFIGITILVSDRNIDSTRYLLLNSNSSFEGILVITVLNDEIEQFQFGILSLLVVANFVCLNPIFRQKSNIIDAKWYFQLIVIPVLITFPVVSSWYLSRRIFAETDKLSLISTVACFVPIMVLGFYVHGQWVKEDFNVFRSSVEIPVGLRENEQLSSYYKALKRAKKDALCFNIKMISMIVAVVFCFCVWGFGLCYEIPDLGWQYCTLFPASVLSICLGVLAAQLWFNTLVMSSQLVKIYVAHLLCIIVAFSLGFAEVLYYRGDLFYDFLDIAAFFLLMTPVFISAVAALRVLRDDSFRLSWPIIIVLSFCTLVTISLSSWVSIRFSNFAMTTYFLVLFVAFNTAVVWVWWEYTTQYGIQSCSVKKWHMCIPMSVMIFFLVSISIYNYNQSIQNSVRLEEKGGFFGIFADPLHGVTFLLFAFGMFAFLILFIRYCKDRELMKEATCLCPSPSPLGIPIIAYKVETKGGELLVQNYTTYLIGFLVICGACMGYVISILLDSNFGSSVGAIAICLGAIFSVHMSCLRYQLFRDNLRKMNLSAIENVFDQILKESVERCLQISQQAMMAAWLADIEKQGPESFMQSADDRILEISTSEQYEDYFKQVVVNDSAFERSTRDSLKYEALFHILFWMRTTQLNLKEAIRAISSEKKSHIRMSSMTELKTLRRNHETQNLTDTVTTRKITLHKYIPASKVHHYPVTRLLTDEQVRNFVCNEEEWTDGIFPPTNGSLYIDWDDDDEFLQDMDEEEIRGAIWCRPSEICLGQEYSISRGTSYDPTEVMQGGVGDCWLLSAISVVALYPKLLDRIIVPSVHAAQGVFHIRLFLDGKWENILIDDLFPCCLDQSVKVIHGQREIVDAPPDVLTGEHHGNFPLPQYCKTRSANVIWPMLIEKAYAKRFGSYEALNGGHVHTAFVDLTGGFSQLVSLQEDFEVVYSGALWEKLVECYKRGALLAAGSPSSSDSSRVTIDMLQTDENGIVSGHAYSIVRVEDQADFHGHHRLLQLRDPWGISKWRGRWSRRDTKSWTRRMQKRLSYMIHLPSKLRKLQEAMGSTFHEYDIVDDEDKAFEGEFWISLEDFISSFKWLYICHLFDPEKWLQKSISGKWSGITAGGPPNQPGAKNNPQYLLKLLNKSSSKDEFVTLFLSITNLQEFCEYKYDQDDMHGSESEFDYSVDQSGRRYPFMSVLLLEIKGQRLSSELLAKDVVASSGKYKDSRDLSLETKLPYSNNITYTIFPSLYPAGTEGEFRINVYCEADFTLEEIV